MRDEPEISKAFPRATPVKQLGCYLHDQGAPNLPSEPIVHYLDILGNLFYSIPLKREFLGLE
jgi:hypothetical protein